MMWARSGGMEVQLGTPLTVNSSNVAWIESREMILTGDGSTLLIFSLQRAGSDHNSYVSSLTACQNHFKLNTVRLWFNTGLDLDHHLLLCISHGPGAIEHFKLRVRWSSVHWLTTSQDPAHQQPLGVNMHRVLYMTHKTITNRSSMFQLHSVRPIRGPLPLHTTVLQSDRQISQVFMNVSTQSSREQTESTALFVPLIRGRTGSVQMLSEHVKWICTVICVWHQPPPSEDMMAGHINMLMRTKTKCYNIIFRNISRWFNVFWLLQHIRTR